MSNENKFRICFKTCVPRIEDLYTWGDYYLVKSLGDALVRLGHDYIIQTISEWYDKNDENYNVVIHVRGLTPYRPKPDKFNIMWNISHPGKIATKEYNKYDLVLFSSKTYWDRMKDDLDVPTGVLLQFTDSNHFFYEYNQSYNTEVLFVGNSRKKDRLMVREAIKSDLDLTVIGNDWGDLIEKKYIKSNWFPNDKLRVLYSSCRILLNDHWDDMNKYGFINNRLFDALACKAIVINDENPGIKDVFPNSIIYDKKSQNIKDLVDEINQNYDHHKQKAEILQQEVLKFHTADARAIELLAYLNKMFESRKSDLKASLVERIKVRLVRSLGYGRIYKALKKPYKWLESKKYQVAYYKSKLQTKPIIEKGSSKVICFLVSEDGETVNGDFFSAKALGDALKRYYGYLPLFLSKGKKYRWNEIPRNSDVVISMLHDTDLRYIDIPENSKKIAWIRSYGQEWIDNPSIKLYDGILTTSEYWAAEINNNRLKDKFLGVVPLAFNDENINFMNENERNIDVCFVGNIFGYERQITRDLDLKQDINFHFYGRLMTKSKHPWEKFHRGVLSHSKIFDIYRRSKIVIEDNTVMTRNTVNLRTYEAAGCGALIISNESEAMRDLLGDNVVFYRDKEDLSKKIKYYLTHPDQRRKIADNARQIILDSHTFRHRAEMVHKLIR